MGYFNNIAALPGQYKCHTVQCNSTQCHVMAFSADIYWYKVQRNLNPTVHNTERENNKNNSKRTRAHTHTHTHTYTPKLVKLALSGIYGKLEQTKRKAP